MSDVDPHEIRMAASQGAMVTLDALDDTTIELFGPVAASLDELVAHLRTKDLPSMHITQVLIGTIVAAVYREHEG